MILLMPRSFAYSRRSCRRRNVSVTLTFILRIAKASMRFTLP